MPYFCAAAPISSASRVPLAGLQRHARVAQLAAEQQALEVDQRFVDHHRLDLGRARASVLGIRPQVAMRRLLDVLQAVQRRGRPLADLGQEIEHVLDVRALLVEVEPSSTSVVQPRRGLGLGRHALDRHHAVHVPRQVVAVELDLQMRQAVGQRSTRGSVSGSPSLTRCAMSASVSGSSAPTR